MSTVVPAGALSTEVVLGILGVIAAFAGLAWPVFTRTRARATKLEVQVRHAGPFGRMLMVDPEGHPRPEEGRLDLPDEYELWIHVVNHGEAVEHLRAIAIEAPSAGAGARPEPPYWYHECAERLEPKASFQHRVPVSGLRVGEGSPAGIEFVAHVVTATGKRVESPVDEVTPDFVRLSDENQP